VIGLPAARENHAHDLAVAAIAYGLEL